MSTFEVYEDAAGEWRWRLVARNGEIVADSGEGYGSRSGAREAAERVRGGAPEADLPDIDGPAFEVYEDSAGEWRWRLRYANGEIGADSGEGYGSRSAARDAAERVQDGADDADIETE
ncbi:Uncharacterized conserved protein YegP, UPF0339 family [Haloplanus vescus]|uniref:Uncharacterized conserved protein YegP, UPF0339 family n=1 Tax=Haloplanus vescus TaxID=555874 RepID=A0A1H3Z7X6_9EURY|nr:Uncharacterized conserved protein YegP, UPF0339 family [Haloplanus vescus]